MIIALMAFVCAVVVFAWLVAAAVYIGAIVTGIVSLISQVRERLDGRPEDADSPALETEFQDADVEFLHEVGIKL
jgi:sugar phosphate permease